jgi:hypothetical protein
VDVFKRTRVNNHLNQSNEWRLETERKFENHIWFSSRYVSNRFAIRSKLWPSPDSRGRF